jgi:hypothetical protein
MRRSEELLVVVGVEPGFRLHVRPLSINCGIPPKTGSTFGITRRSERKHAPAKEVAHV